MCPKMAGRDIDMPDSLPQKPLTRQHIIARSLDWVGTPYQHQCSRKMDGCDCLGLVRGLWREFYGQEPEPLPPYTPDWAEGGDTEILLQAARKYLLEKPIEKRVPGDVLVFRMQDGVIAKHMAILVEADLIVHAYWGRAVTRSFLAPFWRKRLVGVFSFPGSVDENEAGKRG